MPDRFLTLREAEEFTGKSRSTLRRFLDGIVKTADSPDRKFLQPTPEEVAGLKEKNQPFSWKIAEELLKQHFDVGEPEQKQSTSTGGGETDRLVAVLEKSIAMLEKELNEKNSQLSQFHERQREYNVLLRDLQDRLALTSPKRSDEDDVVETPATGEQGSQAANSKRTDARSRKSFFRLFRK